MIFFPDDDVIDVDSVLAIRRTDLCDVCVHVSFPYPVVWAEQGDCQERHVTYVECLEAAQTDVE